jgi:serine/threonine-protein kinase
VSEETDERLRDARLQEAVFDPTVERLPSPPGGLARIDTLTEEFISAISRRPHLIGDVIAARYKLVDVLGNGAMGEVFVAENLAIGRRVAIKVLRAELLSDVSFRKRFQHEAMAIAAIEHRNVARFFDLIVGDPTFLVMEYVPGRTLSAALKKEGKLPPLRAVVIAVRLAWALDAAHRAGVIHRDIKPGNVILAPDPEIGEEPKLIDFGLAKLPMTVGAEELTRTGQIVGTPQYMSPEQIANKEVDARSDVYSLGCLLYHALAGRPPFTGGDDLQILYQHVHQPAESLAPLLGDEHPELAVVVARMLAKRPEDRPQTMKELVALLGEVDRRKPMAPAPAPPPAVARPPSLMVPIVLAVVAALGAGIIAFLVGRRASDGSAGTLLVVTSRPSGAQVDLDGKPLAEATPTAVRHLSAGEHRLRVSKSGRDVIEQKLLVGTDERVAVDVALPPASHAVEVQSIPSGARVFLDGAQIAGQTPLTVSLADDDFHELRLEKLGYEQELKSIKPEDRDPVVSIPMRPERYPRGQIMVDSASGAEVWIDGANTGYVTPTIGIQVPAGEHAVELHDSMGVRSKVRRVTVQQGETLRLTLNVGGEP